MVHSVGSVAVCKYVHLTKTGSLDKRGRQEWRAGASVVVGWM
jgi:hypothetical protein